jgi:hypothetical protein
VAPGVPDATGVHVSAPPLISAPFAGAVRLGAPAGGLGTMNVHAADHSLAAERAAAMFCACAVAATLGLGCSTTGPPRIWRTRHEYASPQTMPNVPQLMSS